MASEKVDLLKSFLKKSGMIVSLTAAELGLVKDRSMLRALSSALAADTGLQTSELRSNSLGSEGARMLVESLKRHPCLMTLVLHDNHIGAIGAVCVAKL